jgi:EAL domain-containing protein (putative c-di-GMP-specific phosphodiesterase class I)
LADSAHDRVALENDLKTALREARLEVHYQPKISCKTAGICGAEALIRWHHPTRGWVSPAQIIEIAEEAGLIGEIGNYVLVRALDDFRTIALTRKMSLAVNISPFQLEDIRFPGRVMELMEAYNFPADRLELEITETCAMREIAVAREAIHELRKRGIRFAIDDFGAGYSNLSSMARLPFDTVKLDSSLIRHAGAERESQTLVKIALSMARELQFETVVEGVETAEQYDFVSQHGADLVQGFLFSPAVPIDNFRALIEPSKLMRLIPRNGIAPVSANRAASSR